MKLEIPELALVVLVGPTSAGKSSFAARHFAPTEVLSSDHFRALVADDESDQAASTDAFEAMFAVAGIRLRRKRLTVLDATHVQREDRVRAIALAREHHVLPVAIVFDLPKRELLERHAARADRAFHERVVYQQASALRRSIAGLQREGFRRVWKLRGRDEVDAAEIVRTRLWTDRSDLRGPFDVIGDVHGCFDELCALLAKLGYRVERGGERGFSVLPPEGRTAVFLGDLCDRGPNTPDVLRLVAGMVEAGTALCVQGNHDAKLLRKLRGRDVRVGHGLAESLEQLAAEPPDFVPGILPFLDGLRSHYVLDGGRLVVAHAGLREELQGRASAVVRAFALYGETSGEVDEFGLPVRHDWAREYRGEAMVVYGHTPTPAAEWLNKTICVDTGCVFGGALTALRYPEQELVAVPAERTWYEPVRPLAAEPAARTAQAEHDDLLELADVLGKRIVSTRLRPNVTIREENAAAALEVISRFAADPHWLIHLPPTMSPVETSASPGYLERPAEAFAYFRRRGVDRVVCQEKHMGSRGVIVVCRDAPSARARFGVTGDAIGACLSRTGRKFFPDEALEAAFLARVRDAIRAAGLFDELGTDWLCLDCEVMPWSAKAQALLQQQYAATGAAATAALGATLDVLGRTLARGVDDEELAALHARTARRAENVAAYAEAYRRYCWPVASLDDWKLAPFHVLASESGVHVDDDHDHLWHVQTAERIAAQDPRLVCTTAWRLVDVADEAACAAAIAWWEGLTEAGGEGIVVKPQHYVTHHRGELVQPAVKVRGQSYLRIIYGPDYDLPENLERLRERGLGRKRSLALREFALGVESLERFVRREPLRRVHECVFGVLALESEPVDPRL